MRLKGFFQGATAATRNPKPKPYTLNPKPQEFVGEGLRAGGLYVATGMVGANSGVVIESKRHWNALKNPKP